MLTKIKKWGNSLALRIPKAYAKEVSLEEGTEIKIWVEKGRIIIEPTNDKNELGKILSGIKKENIHTECSWGKPTGKELW